MAVNVKNLKSAQPTKGEPPKREEAPRNTKNIPRETKEPTQGLALMVPASVFSEFSARAGEAFDHKKGCKTNYFLKIWEAHKRNNDW